MSATPGARPRSNANLARRRARDPPARSLLRRLSPVTRRRPSTPQ
jgi:hypothetical protein